MGKTVASHPLQQPAAATTHIEDRRRQPASRQPHPGEERRFAVQLTAHAPSQTAPGSHEPAGPDPAQHGDRNRVRRRDRQGVVIRRVVLREVLRDPLDLQGSATPALEVGEDMAPAEHHLAGLQPTKRTRTATEPALFERKTRRGRGHESENIHEACRAGPCLFRLPTMAVGHDVAVACRRSPAKLVARNHSMNLASLDEPPVYGRRREAPLITFGIPAYNRPSCCAKRSPASPRKPADTTTR